MFGSDPYQPSRLRGAFDECIPDYSPRPGDDQLKAGIYGSRGGAYLTPAALGGHSEVPPPPQDDDNT